MAFCKVGNHAASEDGMTLIDREHSCCSACRVPARVRYTVDGERCEIEGEFKDGQLYRLVGREQRKDWLFEIYVLLAGELRFLCKESCSDPEDAPTLLPMWLRSKWARGNLAALMARYSQRAEAAHV